MGFLLVRLINSKQPIYQQILDLFINSRLCIFLPLGVIWGTETPAA